MRKPWGARCVGRSRQAAAVRSGCLQSPFLRGMRTWVATGGVQGFARVGEGPAGPLLLHPAWSRPMREPACVRGAAGVEYMVS